MSIVVSDTKTEDIKKPSILLEHRIIRLKTVKELTGLSDSTIWRREQAGVFPMRRHLGGKAVGWYYDEVLTWIQNAPKKRSAVAAHNK